MGNVDGSAAPKWLIHHFFPPPPQNLSITNAIPLWHSRDVFYWQFVLGFRGMSQYQCQSSVHAETGALGGRGGGILGTCTHTRTCILNHRKWHDVESQKAPVSVRERLIPLWATAWIFQARLKGVNLCDTAGGDNNEGLYLSFEEKQPQEEERRASRAFERRHEHLLAASSSDALLQNNTPETELFLYVAGALRCRFALSGDAWHFEGSPERQKIIKVSPRLKIRHIYLLPREASLRVTVDKHSKRSNAVWSNGQNWSRSL